MTIARDASSPARFTLTHSAAGGNQDSGTSASFTPPANAWVYLSACINSNSGATPTFTGSVSNTGGGLSAWTLVDQHTNASGGAAAVWRAFVNSSVATTVTIDVLNVGSGTNGADAAAWVDVWTGADSSQSGAATANNQSTTQNISPTVTTTRAGSQVAGVAVDWAALGNPTSTDTIDPYTVATQTSGGRAYKASNSGAPGSVAVNFNAAASSPAWSYVLYEILAPGGAAPPMQGMSRTMSPDINCPY
jgi:hypothetical protein